MTVVATFGDYLIGALEFYFAKQALHQLGVCLFVRKILFISALVNSITFSNIGSLEIERFRRWFGRSVIPECVFAFLLALYSWLQISSCCSTFKAGRREEVDASYQTFFQECTSFPRIPGRFQVISHWL